MITQKELKKKVLANHIWQNTWEMAVNHRHYTTLMYSQYESKTVIMLFNENQIMSLNMTQRSHF